MKLEDEEMERKETDVDWYESVTDKGEDRRRAGRVRKSMQRT